MMAVLNFVEGPVHEGFPQTWATEADGIQWEIRCEGIDANGQGTMCRFFKKTELETSFRALRVNFEGQNRLENAKQAVRELHDEELRNGPLRRSVLQDLQRSHMPGLRIAQVEKTYNEVQRGEVSFATPDEKRVAQALRTASSNALLRPPLIVPTD